MQDFDPIKEKKLEIFLWDNFGQEDFKGELERTKRFFSPFKRKFKNIITIGGTNGKGETSTHLANLIKSTGKKTALWTSPHILSVRERFSFSGELPGYDELLDEFQKAHRRIKIFFGRFSYYEFLFFVFLRMAVKKKMEVLVLEVGLGGRLDAVNHFDANIAVISSISRDHQAILGNTLEKILLEKLGITRPKKPLISALELEYCRFMTQKYCAATNIPHFDLNQLGMIDASMDYSQKNKLLAAFAFEYFNSNTPPKNLILSNYSFLPLKGRFEEMTFGSISFIFVGSHNIDGVRKLVQKVSLKNETFDAALVSFSKRSPKEIETILGILSASFKKVILTSFEHVKAAMDLKDQADKVKIEFVKDWKIYFENKIQNNDKKETVLVTGSYYFVGEVQKFLLSLPPNRPTSIRSSTISDISR
jgi:dihydrofolate synthase / folylpolyglutamate synthase